MSEAFALTQVLDYACSTQSSSAKFINNAVVALNRALNGANGTDMFAWQHYLKEHAPVVWKRFQLRSALTPGAKHDVNPTKVWSCVLDTRTKRHATDISSPWFFLLTEAKIRECMNRVEKNENWLDINILDNLVEGLEESKSEKQAKRDVLEGIKESLRKVKDASVTFAKRNAYQNLISILDKEDGANGHPQDNPRENSHLREAKAFIREHSLKRFRETCETYATYSLNLLDKDLLGSIVYPSRDILTPEALENLISQVKAVKNGEQPVPLLNDDASLTSDEDSSSSHEEDSETSAAEAETQQPSQSLAFQTQADFHTQIDVESSSSSDKEDADDLLPETQMPSPKHRGVKRKVPDSSDSDDGEPTEPGSIASMSAKISKLEDARVQAVFKNNTKTNLQDVEDSSSPEETEGSGASVSDDSDSSD